MKENRRTKNMYQIIQEIYTKYKRTEKIIGFFIYFQKVVILLDLDLIKDICVKDFRNFTNRGNYYNKKDDPVAAHLINLDGVDWRKLRTKLTPTFSSGKIKSTFPTIVDVANTLVEVLEDMQNSPLYDTDVGIEIEDLISHYTTDVIGSVAFGLDCGSLKDPNSKFSDISKTILDFRHNIIIMLLANFFPKLARILRIKTIPEEVSKFFLNVVRQTVTFREQTGTQRNDFLNLLMELRKSGDLTMEEITAQAYVFFVAGHDTSASTLTFCLYELALNQDIQNKARSEINEVLSAHKGILTYEAMIDMKYLLQIMYEAMRKYVVTAVLTRQTAEDYFIPNTDYVIEKGMVVLLPVDAIHHDPDLYPNPKLFDPERFTTAEIEKRHPMAYLAFGRGPRNCIGSRFGKMEVLAGLCLLLKNFKFSPTKKTQIPIKFSMFKLLRASEEGVYLKVEKL
ncbi:probable cytochrome P450 6a13 [Teleopsis dalmanni]|uniref:probable cytochrome P450 6a13 n=1 Tax=Teleopsis dalmanni TaxID=139649 RepID=UPI0018CC8EBE|nr:probable cytochrome P450 6a13 [Teleopsis dalmanni]